MITFFLELFCTLRVGLPKILPRADSCNICGSGVHSGCSFVPLSYLSEVCDELYCFDNGGGKSSAEEKRNNIIHYATPLELF